MSDTENTSADTEPPVRFFLTLQEGQISDNENSGSSTHLSATETNIASGDGGPPPPKTKRTSTVWDSFTVSENDPSKAICKLCKSKLSRGRDAKHYNTTSLHNHLLYVHHMRKPTVSATTSSSSSSSGHWCSAGCCYGLTFIFLFTNTHCICSKAAILSKPSPVKTNYRHDW